MEDIVYFTGLVDDNESLTGEIDDTLAAEVIDFAHDIAKTIGSSPIDFKQKEIRFKMCMGIIRKISKTIAGVTQANSSESISKVKDLYCDCAIVASFGQDSISTETT